MINEHKDLFTKNEKDYDFIYNQLKRVAYGEFDFKQLNDFSNTDTLETNKTKLINYVRSFVIASKELIRASMEGRYFEIVYQLRLCINLKMSIGSVGRDIIVCIENDEDRYRLFELITKTLEKFLMVCNLIYEAQQSLETEVNRRLKERIITNSNEIDLMFKDAAAKDPFQKLDQLTIRSLELATNLNRLFNDSISILDKTINLFQTKNYRQNQENQQRSKWNQIK